MAVKFCHLVHVFEIDILEVTHLSLTTFGAGLFLRIFDHLVVTDLPPLHVFETDVLEVTHLSLSTFGAGLFLKIFDHLAVYM